MASSAMGFVGGLGHLSEAGTGLIYMKARYYGPSFGRFVTRMISVGKKSAEVKTLALFFVLSSLPPGPAERLVRRQS